MKILIAVLLSVICFTLTFANPQVPSGNGTLQADCSICTPANYIHFTGTGYPPGYSILMQVEESDGTGYINPYFATADSNGDFSIYYALYPNDPVGLWTFCTSDYHAGNAWRHAVADDCLSLTVAH